MIKWFISGGYYIIPTNWDDLPSKNQGFEAFMVPVEDISHLFFERRASLLSRGRGVFCHAFSCDFTKVK